jgi:hypothetical protein
MPAFQDLVGHKYGRLLVVAKSNKRFSGRVCWLCLCDCGIYKVVRANALRNGITKSCGCLNREIITTQYLTHGQTGSRTYRAWQDMKTRCRRDSRYKDVGITVCIRWLGSFELFLNDVGECPPGLTLDRIDGTKGYEPGNCRWATTFEQARNTKKNVFLTVNGVRRTVSEWATIIKVSPYTLYDRVRRGWSDNTVVLTPIRKMKYKYERKGITSKTISECCI